MPTFTYKDEQTGQTLTLNRDTEPSDTELEQLFARQQPAARATAFAPQAQTPAASPSILQFAPNASPIPQAPSAVVDLEIMTGAPKPPAPPRPTVRDAIRKAIELSAGGAFGSPTTAQINQLYLTMQHDYDRATKPIDKSERDKAYEIFTAEFVYDNKRAPNAIEARKLYQRAATVGTRPLSEGFMVRDKNGGFAGFTFIDAVDGSVKVRKPNGELVDMTEDYIPATATSFQKDVMPIDKFMKLRAEVTDDEISLNRMTTYLKNVKDLPTGISRVANEIAARFKNLMGDKITKEQITQQVAKGELQGLIGATRLSTVGGGVMTEQDVMRVVQRLGGDVDAYQNPEVVKRAIADVYAERYRRYQDNVNFYNMAVDTYYGRPNSQGSVFHKAIKPIEVNPLIQEGAMTVFGPYQSLEAKKAELAEMEARGRK